MIEKNITLLDAYDGSFSNTYVTYFQGFVSKLPPSSHYICFRDSQYSYVLYFGAGLVQEGNIVSGRVGYYRIYTNNNYRVSSGIGDVYEDITTGMYYSDFDGCPSLMGGEYYVSVASVFALCIIFIWLLLNAIYRLARRFKYRG